MNNWIKKNQTQKQKINAIKLNGIFFEDLKLKNPDVYMEAIPSKYIPQKAKLIESYRTKMAQMAQIEAML